MAEVQKSSVINLKGKKAPTALVGRLSLGVGLVNGPERGLKITKLGLFKYTENVIIKTWNFSDKQILIFLYISAQNIDCEAVLMRTHNLCFWVEKRKIIFNPVNPNFTI